MRIQLLHMFNVTNIPILKFQNLHHKLSISWNFNRYCKNYKKYVRAKSIGFKCKWHGKYIYYFYINDVSF